jgi:pyridoxine 5-phosphate synthase
MRLYINIDHVATVRQARRTDEPDPVRAAALAERAGADGITVHLREDRRHIQDTDVERLMPAVRTVVNLEMAATAEMAAIAERLRPHQVTLVPERREEITTEGGLDCGATRDRLAPVLARLAQAGIRSSLFITADPRSVADALALRPDAIELHTGRYAREWRRPDAALAELAAAASAARGAGVAVHAGHGLTYENVGAVAALADVEELNIGHSVVSRAVLVGMEAAVREMRARIDLARPDS